MVFENLKQIYLHKYLKNKELNHFYLTIVLMNFGISLISIFVPIYLYKLGYSITQILFFFFIWSLSYVIFLYPGSKIVSKIGAKHSILLSTFFAIIYYFGLNFIDNLSFLFFVLPALNALHTLFYWHGYHTLFILHSDKKQRGKEIGFSYILTFASIAIAPFIGGLIAKETFTLLFCIGNFFILISTIPLFLTKENYCPNHLTFKSFYKSVLSRKEKKDILSFSGYAVESIIQAVLWPIYIIIILGTYFKTGLIVSLTTGISLIGIYVAGVLSDKYNKIKLIKIWSVFHSLAWIARIFVNSMTKIFFIDSYKGLTQKLLYVPWETQIYKLADKRKYFEFIIFEHLIFQFTRVLILPILMAVFFFDFYPFVTTFIIAAFFSLFYGFIKRK